MEGRKVSICDEKLMSFIHLKHTFVSLSQLKMVFIFVSSEKQSRSRSIWLSSLSDGCFVSSTMAFIAVQSVSALASSILLLLLFMLSSSCFWLPLSAHCSVVSSWNPLIRSLRSKIVATMMRRVTMAIMVLRGNLQDLITFL